MGALEKHYGRQTFNLNNLISSVNAEEKGKIPRIRERMPNIV